MARRTPAHNPLAIALQAVLLFYVVSYIGIRFTSVRFPATSAAGGKIVFGMSQSEYLAGFFPGPPAGFSLTSRKSRFLQTLYLPLRWADRLITDTTI